MSDAPSRGPNQREPRDYRPDLRPMAILAAIIVLIVVAWLILSPLILPAPR